MGASRAIYPWLNRRSEGTKRALSCGIEHTSTEGFDCMDWLSRHNSTIRSEYLFREKLALKGLQLTVCPSKRNEAGRLLMKPFQKGTSTIETTMARCHSHVAKPVYYLPSIARGYIKHASTLSKSTYQLVQYVCTSKSLCSVRFEVVK